MSEVVEFKRARDASNGRGSAIHRSGSGRDHRKPSNGPGIVVVGRVMVGMGVCIQYFGLLAQPALPTASHGQSLADRSRTPAASKTNVFVILRAHGRAVMLLLVDRYVCVVVRCCGMVELWAANLEISSGKRAGRCRWRWRLPRTSRGRVRPSISPPPVAGHDAHPTYIIANMTTGI